MTSTCSQLSNRLSDLITKLTECQTVTHIALNECSQSCAIDKYHTIDGKCNNLQHPDWGSSYQPFYRLLPSGYQDGVDMLRGRGLIGGVDLPTAIQVSQEILALHVNRHLIPTNALLMHIGQFLDHDMTLSPTHRQCTNCNKKNEYCVRMTTDNERCARFQRSNPVCGSGLSSWLSESVKSREQVLLYY